jgi:hypothetical protein
MFAIKNINFNSLKEFINHPDKHVENFVSTFEKTIKQTGSDSFTPMLTIFKDLDQIEITIQCRDHEDKDDMYKALNEMLQFYSATNAHSFILAMDIRQTIYSQDNPNSKKSSPVDALSLTFASEDASGVLIIPYQVMDDNVVVWDLDNAHLTSLANDDPSESYQGELPELLYVMTHLDSPLFTPAQLLNFYNFKGYNYIFPEESTAQRIIKVEI